MGAEPFNIFALRFNNDSGQQGICANGLRSDRDFRERNRRFLFFTLFNNRRKVKSPPTPIYCTYLYCTTH